MYLPELEDGTIIIELKNNST